MALFIAWYLRKFLIEYFITYGIRSKFLYWLCIVPVIGFIVFAILQADNTRQERHSQKVDSMGDFAGSSNTAITAIFFFAIVIRLIMRIAGGDQVFIFSLGISILLFIWVISSRMGYYVSLVIAGIGILGVIVATQLISSDSDSVAEVLGIYFGLLLLYVIQLVFIYPVYHFENFEYIPAEDPVGTPVREGVS
jgi:amino acid transporter